jgi:hypothetical protein
MVFPEAISSNTERKKKGRFQKGCTEDTGQQLWLDQTNQGSCDVCIYEQLNQVRTRLIDSSSIQSTEDPANLSAGPGAHGCDVVKRG